MTPPPWPPVGAHLVHAVGMLPSTSTCKRCRAPIAWAVTANARAMPLDIDPLPANANVEVWAARGRLYAVVVDPGAGSWVSHFATCPASGR